MEGGIKPERIVSTSVGAINGSMVALDFSPDEIRGWWQRLRERDIVRPRLDVWRLHKWHGYKDVTPLRRLLERHVDVDALRSCDLDLWVTAVDLDAGTEIVWTQDELTVDHLMASAALSPGLPPVRIDGRLYVDGSVWANPPLRPAYEAGARRIYGILHAPVDTQPAPTPVTLKDMIWRTSSVYYHARAQAELDLLRLRQSLPRTHPKWIAETALTILAPHPPIEEPILDFDPRKAQEYLVRGEEDAKRILPQTP